MIESKISSAIEEGLKIIKEGFNKNLFLNYQTPFVSILIWQCLNTINNPRAKKVVKLGVKELLKEKNESWSFNYWLKTSEKYKNEPYPDDLDDTFCALNVILGHDRKLIKGKDWVKIANLLIACEQKTGGPYKTWWVGENEKIKWSDVDLAVNCNIGYFLKLQEIELKNINSLLEKAIDENKLTSPYYKGIWPIIYFASRFYQGKAKSKLIKIIKKNINNETSIMERAIALSSLIRLGDKKKNVWIDLMNQISDIELCKNEDFYFYVDGDKKYIGHKLLTVALTIEALSLFEQKKIVNYKNSEIETIKIEVLNEINRCFLTTKPEVKTQINQMLKKITKKENTDVILMSPFTVASSLIDVSKINKEFLIKMSIINTLGWMAYTIYDDLMDSDKPISWLPAANIICRKMDIRFVQLLPETSNFLKEYQKIMDEMEEANFWEMKNCHGNGEEIPDFSKIETLSNRSMGHALTSMAVLYKSEASLKDILKLKDFFRFFLAAKQMSDDAHDWENDLKKGQINSAGAELFKVTSERKNYSKLKLIFWEEVFDKYAERILNYCSGAKISLKQITCLKNTDGFDRMIDKVIKSTQMALDEKEETITFINNYYQK